MILKLFFIDWFKNTDKCNQLSSWNFLEHYVNTIQSTKCFETNFLFIAKRKIFFESDCATQNTRENANETLLLKTWNYWKNFRVWSQLTTEKNGCELNWKFTELIS